MAQSKKQLDNLKRGNPDTQFVSGREASENGRKGRAARSEKRARNLSLAEAAKKAAALPLNEIGLNALKRRGLDINTVEPGDIDGLSALAMGQMIAGIHGNSQAAQVFADWMDLEDKHRRDQLEIERLQEQIAKTKAETERLQAEIERIRSGQGTEDDDQVLRFIEGMKHGNADTEAD